MPLNFSIRGLVLLIVTFLAFGSSRLEAQVALPDQEMMRLILGDAFDDYTVAVEFYEGGQDPDFTAIKEVFAAAKVATFPEFVMRAHATHNHLARVQQQEGVYDVQELEKVRLLYEAMATVDHLVTPRAEITATDFITLRKAGVIFDVGVSFHGNWTSHTFSTAFLESTSQIRSRRSRGPRLEEPTYPGFIREQKESIQKALHSAFAPDDRLLVLAAMINIGSALQLDLSKFDNDFEKGFVEELFWKPLRGMARSKDSLTIERVKQILKVFLWNQTNAAESERIAEAVQNLSGEEIARLVILGDKNVAERIARTPDTTPRVAVVMSRAVTSIERMQAARREELPPHYETPAVQKAAAPAPAAVAAPAPVASSAPTSASGLKPVIVRVGQPEVSQPNPSEPAIQISESLLKAFKKVAGDALALQIKSLLSAGKGNEAYQLLGKTFDQALEAVGKSVDQERNRYRAYTHLMLSVEEFQALRDFYTSNGQPSDIFGKGALPTSEALAPLFAVSCVDWPFSRLPADKHQLSSAEVIARYREIRDLIGIADTVLLLGYLAGTGSGLKYKFYQHPISRYLFVHALRRAVESSDPGVLMGARRALTTFLIDSTNRSNLDAGKTVAGTVGGLIVDISQIDDAGLRKMVLSGVSPVALPERATRIRVLLDALSAVAQGADIRHSIFQYEAPVVDAPAPTPAPTAAVRGHAKPAAAVPASAPARGDADAQDKPVEGAVVASSFTRSDMNTILGLDVPRAREALASLKIPTFEAFVQKMPGLFPSELFGKVYQLYVKLDPTLSIADSPLLSTSDFRALDILWNAFRNTSNPLYYVRALPQPAALIAEAYFGSPENYPHGFRVGPSVTSRKVNILKPALTHLFDADASKQEWGRKALLALLSTRKSREDFAKGVPGADRVGGGGKKSVAQILDYLSKLPILELRKIAASGELPQGYRFAFNTNANHFFIITEMGEVLGNSTSAERVAVPSAAPTPISAGAPEVVVHESGQHKGRTLINELFGLEAGSADLSRFDETFVRYEIQSFGDLLSKIYIGTETARLKRLYDIYSRVRAQDCLSCQTQFIFEADFLELQQISDFLDGRTASSAETAISQFSSQDALMIRAWRTNPENFDATFRNGSARDYRIGKVYKPIVELVLKGDDASLTLAKNILAIHFSTDRARQSAAQYSADGSVPQYGEELRGKGSVAFIISKIQGMTREELLRIFFDGEMPTGLRFGAQQDGPNVALEGLKIAARALNVTESMTAFHSSPRRSHDHPAGRSASRPPRRKAAAAVPAPAPTPPPPAPAPGPAPAAEGRGDASTGKRVLEVKPVAPPPTSSAPVDHAATLLMNLMATPQGLLFLASDLTNTERLSQVIRTHGETLSLSLTAMSDAEIAQIGKANLRVYAEIISHPEVVTMLGMNRLAQISTLVGENLADLQTVASSSLPQGQAESVRKLFRLCMTKMGAGAH